MCIRDRRLPVPDLTTRIISFSSRAATSSPSTRLPPAWLSSARFPPCAVVILSLIHISRDLGASPARVLKDITLPLVFPAVLSGMMLCLLLLCSCSAQTQKETQVANANHSKENALIENIKSVRSIRQYKPQAVNRDTMQIILDCGIDAPNGQNKQSWEVRVVDNPDFINGITEIYKKENPKAAEDPKDVYKRQHQRN